MGERICLPGDPDDEGLKPICYAMVKLQTKPWTYKVFKNHKLIKFLKKCDW